MTISRMIRYTELSLDQSRSYPFLHNRGDMFKIIFIHKKPEINAILLWNDES
jgi:hypothetical protein